MIIEILPDGILSSPIVMRASMIVVRLDDGTPILISGDRRAEIPAGRPAIVAGDFGPEGACRAAHALDDDFQSTLESFGINTSVICDRLVLPPPPAGAQLIKGAR